jgi:hypothetical protein
MTRPIQHPQPLSLADRAFLASARHHLEEVMQIFDSCHPDGETNQVRLGCAAYAATESFVVINAMLQDEDARIKTWRESEAS